MAQMPITLLAGRANQFTAAPTQPPVLKTGATIPHSSYLFDPGGVSGPLLRPGAVDQVQFKAALAEAQKQSVLAPASPPAATAKPAIPTLSPAQLAAIGAVEEPSGGELTIDIPGPAPARSGKPDSSGTGPGTAIGPGGDAPGAPVSSGAPVLETNPRLLTAPAAEAPAATDSASDLPADAPAATDATPPRSEAPAPQASAERGLVPGSRRGADGVWELPRLPDKDERQMMFGQKWRVVESEESRKLFLGPDGEFGWDDFVDLINPLQHIPFVNIAYRAITGDEIYGAARMVDFAFGPLAGVSTAADLAVQSVTGKSMVDNGIAMLFGTGDEAGDVASISTASGNAGQLADAGIVRGSHE